MRGAGAEAGLEERLMAVGRAMPDGVLLPAVAAVAALTGVLLPLRPRRTRRPKPRAGAEDPVRRSG
ncbi:hypothetical protein Shyhy01_61180 [Streptomyces hygroscopicus subsp. hygroscopicus]|nr:hypothetical protein Shyhy01_61180 [Streptomyces hygroscopicus subsp. hygroscopicus]